MKVHFLTTASMVFFCEYIVMLLLITLVKETSTRTCMYEISSVLLKFSARFWQFSKMLVIPPQISSILFNFQRMERVATLLKWFSFSFSMKLQMFWQNVFAMIHWKTILVFSAHLEQGKIIHFYMILDLTPMLSEISKYFNQ